MAAAELKVNEDIVILWVIGVLSILTFAGIIYFADIPEHGPSMYEDALKIHEGSGPE